MTTYGRTPKVFTRGEGARLWDVEGREYQDFVAGIAVCNLGHANPVVAEAVAEQARKLIHVSNLYYTEPMIELAEKLVSSCFADRVFFCNSGAEANEGAIKLARRFMDLKGEPDRYKVITVSGSFHGRTLATLTATGQDKIKEGFSPLPEGFAYAPWGDLEAMAKAIDENTAAVLVEPVLGEGGVIFPEPGYLAGLRRICDETATLLIFDEIQTGLGRTGTLFAHHAEGVEPDVMTLAKGIANGMPMGALLAVEEVAAAFTPGSHATTFGGTPLVASAANATWDQLTAPGFLEDVRERGAYFLNRLNELKDRHPAVIDARGRGMMLALALDRPGGPAAAELLDKGYVVNCTQETILRFVPPLVVEKAQIDSLCDVLDHILAGMTG